MLIALLRRPFASYAFEGFAIFNPRIAIKSDSRHWHQCKYLKVLLRLLHKPAHDLRYNGTHSTKCNPINFEKSTESYFGIKNEEQLVDNPFELNMTNNKYRRIHKLIEGST